MDLLEMTKLRSNFSTGDQIKSHEGPQNYTILRSLEARCCGNPIKVIVIFVVCFLGFFVLFSVLKSPSSSDSEARLLDFKPFREGDTVKQNIAGGDNIQKPVEVHQDKLLGGFLSAGLDENSCLSRYQSVCTANKKQGSLLPILSLDYTTMKHS